MSGAARDAATGAGERSLVPSRAEWVALGVLLVAGVAAWWPGWEDALRYPDSHGYVQWPTIRVSVELTIPSKRPPGYPLTVALLGVGPALVHVQTWLLLAAFGWLGWVVARVPGVLVALLLASSGAVHPWSRAVLTESITCAMLAIATGIAWLLCTRPLRRPGAWAGALAGVALYMVTLRDASFLLVAPFAVAFLRFGWRQTAAAAAFVALLAIGSALSSHFDERWLTPYYTALWTRVGPDAEASAHFRARGMPELPYLARGPVPEAFRDWLYAGGRRDYELWVIGRARSWSEAAALLPAREAGAYYRGRYFEQAPPPALLERVADRLWAWTGPPLWAWGWLVLLPAVEWAVQRRVTPATWLAAALVPAAYVAGFAAHHGAGTESERHMLTPALQYRFATLLVLVAAFRIVTASRAASPPSAADAASC